MPRLKTCMGIHREVRVGKPGAKIAQFRHGLNVCCTSTDCTNNSVLLCVLAV